MKCPTVREELVRLSLAVKQRKIEHRNGDLYHVAVFFWNVDPSNDLFSKQALWRYAQQANRDIPPFLRSVSANGQGKGNADSL